MMVSGIRRGATRHNIANDRQTQGASMRTVVVSGANRGLGLEFCRQLVARGERVIGGCRQPSRAGELTRLAVAHPGRLTILPLDLAKPSGIVEFARELGMIAAHIDVLINNAGVLPGGERYGEIQAKALSDAFAINCAGPLLLTQALTERLEQGTQPRVLNLTSELGSIARRDACRTPSYCISKAALNMATRLIAFELTPRGIVCFAAHPGWVRTDMGGEQAPVAPKDSIAALLGLLDRADAGFAGRFFDRDGAPIPW
jgi:NAD(P)-dependent dehydrogenase (short-subunit alcohol dehydrogenase family)